MRLVREPITAEDLKKHTYWQMFLNMEGKCEAEAGYYVYYDHYYRYKYVKGKLTRYEESEYASGLYKYTIDVKLDDTVNYINANNRSPLVFTDCFVVQCEEKPEGKEIFDASEIGDAYRVDLFDDCYMDTYIPETTEGKRWLKCKFEHAGVLVDESIEEIVRRGLNRGFRVKVWR